jgi:hypothetical protein
MAIEKQRDMFTRRWRTPSAMPSAKEVTALHIPLVGALRLMLRPEVVFFHTPNGELRDPRTARKLRAMGTLPGVADLTFLSPPGRVLFLELKLPGGRPTVSQLEFAQRVQVAGAEYVIVHSIAGALELLAERGLLKSGVRIERRVGASLPPQR